MLGLLIFAATVVNEPKIDKEHPPFSSEAIVAILIAASSGSVAAGAWLTTQLNEKTKLEFKNDAEKLIRLAITESLAPLAEAIKENELDKKTFLERIENCLQKHSNEILVINQVLAYRQEVSVERDERLKLIENTLKKLEIDLNLTTAQTSRIQKYLETATQGGYKPKPGL